VRKYKLCTRPVLFSWPQFAFYWRAVRGYSIARKRESNHQSIELSPPGIPIKLSDKRVLRAEAVAFGRPRFWEPFANCKLHISQPRATHNPRLVSRVLWFLEDGHHGLGLLNYARPSCSWDFSLAFFGFFFMRRLLTFTAIADSNAFCCPRINFRLGPTFFGLLLSGIVVFFLVLKVSWVLSRMSWKSFRMFAPEGRGIFEK